MNCRNCNELIDGWGKHWHHVNGGSSVQYCCNVHGATERGTWEMLWMEGKQAEPSKEDNVIEILRQVDAVK